MTSPDRAAQEPRATNLTSYAWLSIGAAVATIALKSAAYLLTGSVGLLSDAAESVVNLVAGFVALAALHVAARPPDADHNFGHAKAEYFSAAIEGLMILVAAVFIVWSAVERFLNPRLLENVDLGLAVSTVASVINLVVGLLLIRAGRRHRSITLVADGKHLLTDVWTSVGVIVGVLLVAVTGWLRLDPMLALLVGTNIIWTGARLVRDSVDGLMDKALHPALQEQLGKVLESLSEDDVHFHAVRTRQAGHRYVVAMHVLVPGGWTVQRGHDLLEQVEDRLRREFGHIDIDTHLEPLEDPRAYEDGSPPPSRSGPVA